MVLLALAMTNAELPVPTPVPRTWISISAFETSGSVFTDEPGWL